jgi:hypothetical protein
MQREWNQELDFDGILGVVPRGAGVVVVIHASTAFNLYKVALANLVAVEVDAVEVVLMKTVCFRTDSRIGRHVLILVIDKLRF